MSSVAGPDEPEDRLRLRHGIYHTEPTAIPDMLGGLDTHAAHIWGRKRCKCSSDSTSSYRNGEESGRWLQSDTLWWSRMTRFSWR